MLISFCLRWKRCSLSAHWQASWLAQLQLFSGWIFSLRHLANTHPHVLFSGCALVTILSSASWHPAKAKYHSSELQECRDLHNEKHLLIYRYFADIYMMASKSVTMNSLPWWPGASTWRRGRQDSTDIFKTCTYGMNVKCQATSFFNHRIHKMFRNPGTLTLDIDMKVTRIQTHLNLLVDAPMAWISKSYITYFSSCSFVFGKN